MMKPLYGIRVYGTFIWQNQILTYVYEYLSPFRVYKSLRRRVLYACTPV